MITPTLPSWIAPSLTTEPGDTRIIVVGFADPVTIDQARRAATVTTLALRSAGCGDVDVADTALIDGTAVIVPLTSIIDTATWRHVVAQFAAIYAGDTPSTLLDASEAAGTVTALWRSSDIEVP